MRYYSPQEDKTHEIYHAEFILLSVEFAHTEFGLFLWTFRDCHIIKNTFENSIDAERFLYARYCDSIKSMFEMDHANYKKHPKFHDYVAILLLNRYPVDDIFPQHKDFLLKKYPLRDDMKIRIQNGYTSVYYV